MATPALSPSSVTVPNGGTANVSVSWSLAPAVPDVNGTLNLTLDGVSVGSIPVTKQGRPAEVAPTLVTSNPAAGQVLVTCDVAPVALVNQSTIRLG